MQRACKNDHYLTDEAICPLCGGPTSKNWSGILTIIDPENSQMAEAMNVTKPGSYALKVR